MYRKAKEFFDQQNINLVGGLSFTKAADRAGKSLEEPVSEVETANTVETRENALENYVMNRAKNFFQERSLSWDFASAGRSLSNAIPDDIKASVRALIVEERGKKKKILKKLLPLLGLLKVKLAALGVLSLFGIAIIAKKALLLSLLSIAISGFSFIQRFISGRSGATTATAGGSSAGWSAGGSGAHGHEEIIAYTNGGGGNGGWSSGGGNGGGGGWNSGYDSYGEHGSHSSPVAQSIAYSGHHKVARR